MAESNMASLTTLDFDVLLAPLPGANPSGQSLRFDGVYDEIQKAREDEQPGMVPSGRELRKADWPLVTELATNALTQKTKDLQIAAWLTEALFKQRGFAGLREGLRLVRELLERYWDTVHPEPKGKDFGVRRGPLNWLNVNMPMAIRAIAESTGEFSDTMERDVQGTLEEVRLLKDVIQERFPDPQPSVSEIRVALEECCRGILRKETPEPWEDPLPEGTSAGLNPVDRADALRRLAAVATFFRKTEPHSPIAYLIERAMRWGTMPLEDILEEIIGSQDVLAHVKDTLGLKNSKESS